MSGFCLFRCQIRIATTPSSHGNPIPPSGPLGAGQRPDDLIVRVAVEDMPPSPRARDPTYSLWGHRFVSCTRYFGQAQLAASHLPFTHAVGRDDHVEERTSEGEGVDVEESTAASRWQLCRVSRQSRIQTVSASQPRPWSWRGKQKHRDCCHPVVHAGFEAADAVS